MGWIDWLYWTFGAMAALYLAIRVALYLMFRKQRAE
jgi:hypothetical protein